MLHSKSFLHVCFIQQYEVLISVSHLTSSPHSETLACFLESSDSSSNMGKLDPFTVWMGLHYSSKLQLSALWGTFYRLLLTGMLPCVAFLATVEYCSACPQRLNSHSSTGRPPRSLLLPSFYLAAHQEDRTALISLTMRSSLDILLKIGPGSGPRHWTWRVRAPTL